MPLSFDEFKRRVLTQESENDVADDAIEALQFLSMPGASVDDLTDETLQRYIDAVGGVEEWIALRRGVADHAIEVPDTPQPSLDEVEPTKPALTSGEKDEPSEPLATFEEAVEPSDPQLSPEIDGKSEVQEEHDAIAIPAPERQDEPIGIPGPQESAPELTPSLWRRVVSYAAVGMTTAALTLLLVSIFGRPPAPTGSQAGWTVANVDAARQTSDAAESKSAARTNSYEQLAEHLTQLEQESFQDTSQLQEGLTDLAIGCHELRVRVDQFNLDAPDKRWLRRQCNTWATQAMERLSELEQLGPAGDAQAILLDAKRLLKEMRDQLESGGPNAASA